MWEPSGAAEQLDAIPEMIITPVMKNPRASGYISRLDPHGINHILVDDLGRDEILLLSTDSGNVCAYHVEAICSALELAAEFDQKRPLDVSDIHPFFAEFVGASAWGLAIHKFARLIAVSANTCDITVFAFALVDPSAHGIGNHADGGEGAFQTGDRFRDYEQTWEIVDSDEGLSELRRRVGRERSRNVRLSYRGHLTNIPCVSFFNCDIDPNGNWMVSTDINNTMIVWNVWFGLFPYNVCRFDGIVTLDIGSIGLGAMGMAGVNLLP